MSTLNAVRVALDRLGPRGWTQLFERHGLHIDVANLVAELARPLVGPDNKSTIDRSLPGFEDFALDGRAAIEPGRPALSLLYHALASSAVIPTRAGPLTDDDFPTLAELDAVENYIYSLAKKRLSDFANAVVAVVAYQYRIGTRSVHRVHADMAFSRTGIARVGTAPMHYDPRRRSFWVSPQDANGLAVMPARFAAFIAERRPLGAGEVVMHPLAGNFRGDKERVFLIPVHKLFPGDECLLGEHIDQVTFTEYHRSEKLRKIHQLAEAKGGVPPLAGFNINQAPFVRESSVLVKLRPVGASTLLVPNARPALAETTVQHNSVSGKDEVVRFRVPPFEARLDHGRGNRFDDSSFQIPATNAGRAAPEYAHIRLHVRPNGALFNVNTLSTSGFSKVLRSAEFRGIPGVEDGPLEAAHVVDYTCEGAIAAQVNLTKALKTYAAISFVAAPHFLPLVDQMEVQRWAEQRGVSGNDAYFTQGGPLPLCYGRDVAPNPTLLDPITHVQPAFDRGDAVTKTLTAVLGPAPHGASARLPLQACASTSFLPDAAADVFEPGWDTSMFSDQDGNFYVNYGLGSPFPEDAKLCAALNSFWPAAAPDVGRTFGGKTAVPLLDEELGLHPQHPTVLAGQGTSTPGWDGEFGPFFFNDEQMVNFASEPRADYTMNALRGKIGIGLLGRIDAVEQLARMDAFHECANRIRGNVPMREFRPLLVVAEKVATWSGRKDRFDPAMTGPGYRYIFAELDRDTEDPGDFQRRVTRVTTKYSCQITSTVIAIRKDKDPPEIKARRQNFGTLDGSTA